MSIDITISIPIDTYWYLMLLLDRKEKKNWLRGSDEASQMGPKTTLCKYVAWPHEILCSWSAKVKKGEL
jgi:hypothetical protein